MVKPVAPASSTALATLVMSATLGVSLTYRYIRVRDKHWLYSPRMQALGLSDEKVLLPWPGQRLDTRC